MARPVGRPTRETGALQDAMALLARYRDDPEVFVREALGVTPTPQQMMALAAIKVPGAHVSIRSGHETGKSGLLAWLILWYLCTHSECKVPCTAPTSHQLNDVLWSELAKWHSRLKEPFRSQIEINKDRACVKGAEKVEFAVPRTARKENPEALQGFHGVNLLFILDEASGIPDEIFQVAEGALSSRGSRVIMASNPTRTDGFFYDSHHKNRRFWTTLHFSSLDSPLPSPDYGRTMGEKYGEGSNIYQVRVLGEFPTQEADQFIPLGLIEAAVARDGSNGAGPAVWGVDPAYLGGDETVLVKRVGDVFKAPYGVRGYDTLQTTGWIIDHYRQDQVKPQAIVVDMIGIGAGVYDRLRELGYPVIGCNVAESPTSRNKYFNLRAELWGRYREWLEERRGCLPDDADLIAQSSCIKYDFDSSGRIKIESKKDLRKRGQVSPDRADAVCLTFYHSPNVTSEFDQDDYPYSMGYDKCQTGRSAIGGY